MNNGFDIRDGILYKYTGNSEVVVIPDSVHIIHEKAFRFCNFGHCVNCGGSSLRGFIYY